MCVSDIIVELMLNLCGQPQAPPKNYWQLNISWWLHNLGVGDVIPSINPDSFAGRENEIEVLQFQHVSVINLSGCGTCKIMAISKKNLCNVPLICPLSFGKTWATHEMAFCMGASVVWCFQDRKIYIINEYTYALNWSTYCSKVKCYLRFAQIIQVVQ